MTWKYSTKVEPREAVDAVLSEIAKEAGPDVAEAIMAVRKPRADLTVWRACLHDAVFRLTFRSCSWRERAEAMGVTAPASIASVERSRKFCGINRMHRETVDRVTRNAKDVLGW